MARRKGFGKSCLIYVNTGLPALGWLACFHLNICCRMLGKQLRLNGFPHPDRSVASFTVSFTVCDVWNSSAFTWDFPPEWVGLLLHLFVLCFDSNRDYMAFP